MAKIARIEIGIGSVSKNFERVGGFSTAPTGATRVTPDLINGGVRSDTAVFKFSNFDPGETFGFFAEIDDNRVISSSRLPAHSLRQRSESERICNGHVPGRGWIASATDHRLSGHERSDFAIIFHRSTGAGYRDPDRHRLGSLGSLATSALTKETAGLVYHRADSVILYIVERKYMPQLGRNRRWRSTGIRAFWYCCCGLSLRQ